MRLRGLPPPRRAFEPPKLFHRPPLLPAPVPRPGSNAGERQDTPAPTHAAQPRPRDRHCDTGTPHAAHCLTAPCVWRTRHQHPLWLLIHGLGGHLVTSRRWGCQSYPPCSGRGNGRQHAARKDAAAWSGPRGPQAHAPAPGARAEARRGEGAGGGGRKGAEELRTCGCGSPPCRRRSSTWSRSRGVQRTAAPTRCRYFPPPAQTHPRCVTPRIAQAPACTLISTQNQPRSPPQPHAPSSTCSLAARTWRRCISGFRKKNKNSGS